MANGSSGIQSLSFGTSRVGSHFNSTISSNISLSSRNCGEIAAKKVHFLAKPMPSKAHKTSCQQS